MSEHYSANKRPEYKFYGRRTARPLRRHDRKILATKQQYLCDTGNVKVGSVLEIGFGNGEHLLTQAQQNPEVPHIGCDPYINGQVKLLRGIHEEALQNITLWPEDARYLLDSLAENTIRAAYILFPDPWPKTRHFKRRIVQVENFKKLASVCENGALLQIASDVSEYITYVLNTLFQYNSAHAAQWHWTAKTAADWKTPFPHLEGNSAFFARAKREGRTSTFLQLQLEK